MVPNEDLYGLSGLLFASLARKTLNGVSSRYLGIDSAIGKRHTSNILQIKMTEDVPYQIIIPTENDNSSGLATFPRLLTEYRAISRYW